MLVSYLGEEVVSDAKSEIFERPVRFPDSTALLSNWRKAAKGELPATISFQPNTTGIIIPSTGAPLEGQRGFNRSRAMWQKDFLS